MAKTAAEPPGRSGSQFFVVVAADAGLPPDYAPLGEVTSGLGVVERISSSGTRERSSGHRAGAGGDRADHGSERLGTSRGLMATLR